MRADLLTIATIHGGHGGRGAAAGTPSELSLIVPELGALVPQAAASLRDAVICHAPFLIPDKHLVSTPCPHSFLFVFV